ncbi:hypothetical protein OUZ56_007504 [Daphnia magna]|uniref:Uncharacterized protein n=1 Tax=Daphnia magna TaxID=35525 RepID=A0ABR0AA53_9CRUS|nr:hypothetical protein OUZ56_007504 [Daphnia magna]
MKIKNLSKRCGFKFHLIHLQTMPAASPAVLHGTFLRRGKNHKDLISFYDQRRQESNKLTVPELNLLCVDALEPCPKPSSYTQTGDWPSALFAVLCLFACLL